MNNRGIDKCLLEGLQKHPVVDLLIIATTFIVIFFLINEILDWRDVIRSLRRRTTSWRSPSYGYSESNGPAMWRNMYKQSWECQSPINIDTCNTIVVDACPPLVWNHYEKPPRIMTISNKMHTVVLTGKWADGETPTVCGGPLDSSIFRFQKACFRWGPDSTEGSEHAVDFERYAMELQLYHERIAGDPDDFGITSAQENTLAIVSFLFKISSEDNPCLAGVTNCLHSIQQDGTTAYIRGFPLDCLTSPSGRSYYSYSGSFTHPPCSECVTWLVFPETRYISCEQLEKFRQLCDWFGQPILTNTRPVQCVNSRNVLYFED